MVELGIDPSALKSIAGMVVPRLDHADQRHDSTLNGHLLYNFPRLSQVSVCASAPLRLCALLFNLESFTLSEPDNLSNPVIYRFDDILRSRGSGSDTDVGLAREPRRVEIFGAFDVVGLDAAIKDQFVEFSGIGTG